MRRVCELEECTVSWEVEDYRPDKKTCSPAHRAEVSKRKQDPTRWVFDIFSALRGKAARRGSSNLAGTFAARPLTP